MKKIRAFSYPFCLILLIVFLLSCKAKPEDTSPTTLKIQDVAAGSLVALKDASIAAQTAEKSKTGDIEDVTSPPAGTAALTETCDKVCGTFEAKYDCPNLCELMRFVQTWEIKMGDRLGNKTAQDVQDVCGVNTVGSAFSSYGVGATVFSGYTGKEKAFRLVINETGNYRIQVSATDKTKNFDLFIFKNDHATMANNLLDKKKLVKWNQNPTGQTETVHLTEKGHYFIVLDELAASATSCQYGSFILSVSPNTDVVTNTTVETNRLLYDFTLLKTPESAELLAWSFRKSTTTPTDLVPVIRYPKSCRFSFDCSSCDYLVAPVFKNTKTGAYFEGAATVIRP